MEHLDNIDLARIGVIMLDHDFQVDWKCEDDQWAQSVILRMLQAHLMYGGFLHYTTKTLVWCEPSWGVHGSLQDIIVADLIH